MNKREIVLQHREASDELRKAKAEKKRCVSKNHCDKACDCTLMKNIEAAEKKYQHACETLKEMNDAIVRRNEAAIDRRILEDEEVPAIRNVERLEKELQEAEAKWTAALTANVQLQSEKEELQKQLKTALAENKALKREYATLQNELTKANVSINDLILSVSEKARTPEEDTLQKKYDSLVSIAKPMLLEYVESL